MTKNTTLFNFYSVSFRGNILPFLGGQMSTPATRKCVVSNDDDNNEILSRVMTGILTFINNSEIFVKNDLI